MSLATTILELGGAIGISSAILAGLYSVHKVATKIEAVIGTDPDGKTIVDRMVRVEYQLWPNGGESLSDRVDANIETQSTYATDVSLIKKLLVQILRSESNPLPRADTAEALAILSLVEDKKHELETPHRRRPLKQNPSSKVS